MNDDSGPWSPGLRYFVAFLVLLALLALIWLLRDILRPLVIAAFLAYLWSPLVHFVSIHTRLSRTAAGNLVYFVGLGLLLVALVVFLPLLFKQAQEVGRDLIFNLDAWQKFLEQNPLALGPLTVRLDMIIPSLRETYAGATPVLAEQALRLLAATWRNVLWFLVIIVTMYYLMTDWDKLREWLLGLAPEPFRGDARHLYADIRQIWLAYLGGQLRLMLILGLLFTAVWMIIGLRGAVILGVLAGVLNLMPEVGPLIAALLAGIVALLDGSSYLPISNTWFALLVLGLYLFLNNIKIVFIQPRVLGSSVKMHEGLAFLAIIAALVVEGFLGVLIVIPLLASAFIVGRYLRHRVLGQPPFSDEEKLPVVVAAGRPDRPKADPYKQESARENPKS